MIGIKKAVPTRLSLESAQDALKCFLPFLCIILAYSSFKFIVPELSERVHYTLMPSFDKILFVTLPTVSLQHLLWHGYVAWYDYVFYGFYAAHYLLIALLALLVYIRFRSEYFRFAMTYFFATFIGFIFYVLYPSAPPWMASQYGYIPHITRVASNVFASFGVHNFSNLYSSYAPNPIAAVPSLHTTYSVLFVLFIYQLFGKKWAALSLIYPFCIIVGVLYLGEHYFFDVLAGVILAVSAYVLTPVLLKRLIPFVSRLTLKLTFSYSHHESKD